MKLFPALQNVGKTVLFIKDNKVVGKGRGQIGRGDEWHGIRIESGELFEQLKDIEPFNTPGIGTKHALIRFSPTLGSFIGFGFTDEFPQAEEILEYVRVVDEFNLGYRMVPDTFKDTEGYGVAADAWKKDITRIDVYELKNWNVNVPKQDHVLIMEGISRNDMTVERVMQWAQEFGMVEDPTKLDITFYFENKDCVWLHYSKGTYYGLGEVAALELSFGEHSPETFGDEDPQRGSWYSNNTQYFWTGYAEEAIGAFVSRLRAEHPGYRLDRKESEKLDIIKIRQTKELSYESHYNYLDVMLQPFWKLVFDKTPDQTNCAGIVGAHGDKCYSYKSNWEEFKIPFHRGALLYLLTYTSLMNRPKSESCQWVIENYTFYEKLIDSAEKQVLKEQFGIDK
jgi:hypothetical protein